MKSRSYKMVSKMLAALMAVSMCASCGEKEEGNKQTTDGSIPESLSIFCALGGNVASAGGQSFNDCMTFQLLEKKTGCHVEWQHPASSAVADKFSVMVVSGNYPDAIVYNWSNVTGGAQSYVDDEVIVDLTEYVEACMPNLMAFLEKNPDMKKDIYTDDGRILYIPFIRADKELCIYQGQVVRKDWLDKLGLQEPTNTDELYDVLKAFKTGDPNGNGEADEIPMAASGFNSVLGIGNLLWSFGTTYDFHLNKDNEVVYGPLTDEFAKGLEYITKLYSEGLLDVDYLLNTRSKMEARFTGDQSGFSFGYQPSTYYTAMKDSNAEVVGMGFIAGPDGGKYSFNNSYIQPVTSTSLAISTSNENIAGTLKWLDELYGGDGFMYANFGEEGVTYEMEDGKPVFNDYMKQNEEGKTYAQMIGLTCGVRDSAFPMLQSWDYYKQTLQPWGLQAVERWTKELPDTSRILPTALSLTIEEGETYTEIMSQVDMYFQEEVNKIITGKSSISEWQNVVEKIKSMGIEKAVSIKNEAYKRYLDR